MPNPDRNLLFETVTPPNPSIPRLRVGDTARWEFPWADYAGYTLVYTLRGPASLTIAMVESSPGVFSASIPASTTAGYTAGEYLWILAAALGDERVTLMSGVVDIDPDILGVASPIDLRTHARRVLDAIEAVIEGRASVDADQLIIHNRRIIKTPIPDLLKLRDKYRAEVSREDAMAGRTPFRNKVFVRWAR